MKTRFFALAALALALVACNNDNENLNGDPVAAQFTANIAPATRASGTTWTAGINTSGIYHFVLCFESAGYIRGRNSP